jgi:dienelactone hydrolase
MTRSREVEVTTDDTILEGFLATPGGAEGLVIFAHGSGSSRFSDRNRAVAERLNEAGFSTLLFDLLTAEEHARDTQTREHRFDIPLLGRRLTGTVRWARDQTDAGRIGLFGASTGAAAAVLAAADAPDAVHAIVSRGGRPDLGESALERIEAPTLLIVGGDDGPVIELNRRAAARLRCPHELAIVPGASHLFEEPGTLEEAARSAIEWLRRFLQSGPAPT